MKPERSDRLSGAKRSDKIFDSRTGFQRDSDRILYCGAFRRLAVVTQVVSPAGGHAFHNRLTHALKVAQVGKRIAEKLISSTDPDLLTTLGGLDASVVEAAGLAHDLGHPPFGHIAEHELNRLLRKSGEKDGYEGNAQSFRIISRLEVRESGRKAGVGTGLDLTRASLNALLKYPRLRPSGKMPDHHMDKFGAYRADSKAFKFARAASSGEKRSIEAEIMDWADDITYAVHDLEDFYRTGKIPWEKLSRTSDGEFDRFMGAMFERKVDEIPDSKRDEYMGTARDLFSFSPVSDVYTGTRTQRTALHALASSIIHHAVSHTTLTPDGLIRDEKDQRKVMILKQLTWHYVIEDTLLATEQHGKRQVIQDLFKIFSGAALDKKAWKMFPAMFRELLAEEKEEPLRVATDYISSLGEQRAVDLRSELLGLSLKPLVTGITL